MMDESTWVMLASVLLPALISVIVKPGWSNSAKLLTAFGLSAALASIQVFLAGDFKDIPGAVVKVFILVMGSYAIFWRPTGIAQKIEEQVNP